MSKGSTTESESINSTACQVSESVSHIVDLSLKQTEDPAPEMSVRPELNDSMKKKRQDEREKRHQIVLWKRPIVTLKYFLLESMLLIEIERKNLMKHKKTCSAIALFAILVFTAYMVEGPHQEHVVVLKQQLFWCGYWIGLGILSSVGLGTGLHTFILYLGPHIAQVTLAAWECGSLNFPEPPYPNEIICPTNGSSSPVNIFTIMSKIRLEAVMWGAGTALGELPPYFMAKAARLSGTEVDDEELEKLEEIISSEGKDIFTRIKRFVPELVEKVGFFGILACASIPNPLFDLAGITCGHCLVPFWTFFGATLIGKAIIKMHIQQSFVILCFSKSYVESLLQLLGRIPVVGIYIQAPFKKAVDVQREKLHRRIGEGVPSQGGNVLGFIFEKLITVMIIYFVLSIVNSLAQSYAKRIDEQGRQTTNNEHKSK